MGFVPRLVVATLWTGSCHNPQRPGEFRRLL